MSSDAAHIRADTINEAIARLEQGFGRNSAPAMVLRHHFGVSAEAARVSPCVAHAYQRDDDDQLTGDASDGCGEPR